MAKVKVCLVVEEEIEILEDALKVAQAKVKVEVKAKAQEENRVIH